MKILGQVVRIDRLRGGMSVIIDPIRDPAEEDKYFQVIIDSLKYCQENKGLYLLGFIIMPTHLHLITSNSDETNLSDIMRDFRQFTSKRIKDLLVYDKRVKYLEVFEKAACNLPGRTLERSSKNG